MGEHRDVSRIPAGPKCGGVMSKSGNTEFITDPQPQTTLPLSRIPAGLTRSIDAKEQMLRYVGLRPGLWIDQEGCAQLGQPDHTGKTILVVSVNGNVRYGYPILV